MKQENKLRNIRILKITIQVLVLIIILGVEAWFLWYIINILSEINYMEKEEYLNTQLLYIIIGLFTLLFDLIIFSLARWIKIDVYDLYCNDSIDHLEFRIHEFIKMRNQFAMNRNLNDKLILTVIELNDDKRKEKQLVNFK